MKLRLSAWIGRNLRHFRIVQYATNYERKLKIEVTVFDPRKLAGLAYNTHYPMPSG